MKYTFSIFAVSLTLGLLLYTNDSFALYDSTPNYDLDGGGGGGYDIPPDTQIPEIKPPGDSTLSVTIASNGSDTLSSYKYNVQLTNTLWYSWNRWVTFDGTNWANGGDTIIQGYVSGLSQPNITIGYNVGIYDALTLTKINPGSSVSVGKQIILTFGPYVPEDIFWFGTGYSMDSPYGEWRANATPPDRVNGNPVCLQKDFVVRYSLDATPYGYPYIWDFDVFIPLVVNPPTRTITNTGNLSCGTLTTNPDGSASMPCTVTASGAIQPSFNFTATTGKFYYRYYDYRDGIAFVGNQPSGCYGNNIPMTDTFGNVTAPTFNNVTTIQAPYIFSVPAKAIPYSLTAVVASNPPTTPTITCPAQSSLIVGESASFTALATDPDSGATIRYGFDWANQGLVNEWVPASGYVTSGVSKTVSHSWSTAGTYNVKVQAQDSYSVSSAWSATCPITVTAVPPECSDTIDNDGEGLIDYPADTGCTSTSDFDEDDGLGFSAICVPSKTNAFTGEPVAWSAVVTGGSGQFTYSWSGTGGLTGITQILSNISYLSAGQKTASLVVTDTFVPPTPPTATLLVNPTSVFSGSGSTLSWYSTDATVCTGTNFSTGNLTTGSVVVYPTVDTNYSVSCTGAGGTAGDGKTVTITAQIYQCGDDIDNDSDGKIDFPIDLGCTDTLDTTESPNPQCSDGIDNDSDTKIDYPTDLGCSSLADNAESPDPAPQCSDGVDNDSDGFTDYVADAGCTAAADTTESPNPQCKDGIDNDADGYIDYPEAGCSSIYDNNENNTAPPGGGCFAPETLVLMADGSHKQISKVQVGDKVLGVDESSGEKVENTVSEVFVHEGSYETLLVNGTLVVTPNHPMAVLRYGVWRTWVDAGGLQIGDVLIGLDGTVPITSLVESSTLPTVYNLEAIPSHTYFSGGVLVHNKVYP